MLQLQPSSNVRYGPASDCEQREAGIVIFRRLAAGLAGIVAVYAMKKIAKSIEKQVAQARDAQAKSMDSQAQNGPLKNSDIKTLRLDPKTGVYTTDES
jgi:F0F1-type ATP synthase membrane subunit c/vacuolar-type H+-ATPase subunit K